jgi:hypothetical protein
MKTTPEGLDRLRRDILADVAEVVSAREELRLAEVNAVLAGKEIGFDRLWILWGFRGGKRL